eukprot:TRINITY_DN4213_c1_g1_i3.p3 TRINITY_DN4213_c1_g1~~TRINITY_DN4213_c1_g1_i3.p3  ORF type:complete len:305 (+),score=23.81 TRINITY_DN4213_c1_g1_i3:23-916(+)
MQTISQYKRSFPQHYKCTNSRCFRIQCRNRKDSQDGGGWGEPSISTDWGGKPQQVKTKTQQTTKQNQNAQESFNQNGNKNGYQQENKNGYQQENQNGTTPKADSKRSKQRKLNITVLSEVEKNEIVPLIPTGQQAEYYQKRSPGWIPVTFSIMLGLYTSQFPSVSLPLLTWPLWLNWVRAGARNRNLVNNVKSMGLWRTKLAEIKNTKAGIQLILSDTNGGCKTSVIVPYNPGVAELQPGDDAEAIVVSWTQQFTKFQVVREVYVPALELWLGDYPFINRQLFLRISLDIYRASFVQ